MKDDVDSFEVYKYISNSVPDLTIYLVIFIIISIVFYIFAAENQKSLHLFGTESTVIGFPQHH